MQVKPRRIDNNGIDDDGNGLVDVYGWDFAETTIVFDGVDDDHGTHVAGTIGSRWNGKGVAGVVWNVKMLNANFRWNRRNIGKCKSS
jgi:subtilisin family serine protease